MSYFADLTPYSYQEGESDTLNVGWLESGRPFPTGQLSAEFIAKLAWACIHFPAGRGTRGIHQCTLCPPMPHGFHSVVISGKKHLLGTAEIRIQGSEATYASPNLILHYVVDHQYRPSADFVRGVLELRDSLPRETWTLSRGPYW